MARNELAGPSPPRQGRGELRDQPPPARSRTTTLPAKRPTGHRPYDGDAIRFAALGDSLTEGLGDPAPGGGGWRGWAALLADGLGERPGATRLVNLARSGALAADVAGRQLTAARRAGPQLASVIVGGNDTLRAAFDIGSVVESLDRTYGALRAEGAVLLTACLPDPGRMLCLPAPLARPLGRRMRAVNQAVHALSRRHGALHLHLADQRWVARRAAWSVDRLHPSELGHRLLAGEFHAALSAAGLAYGPPPGPRPDGPAPTLAASAWWMATRGTRWIADRCTDLLPGLLGLAALECHHAVRGRTHLLDARSHLATHTALAERACFPPAADRSPATSSA